VAFAEVASKSVAHKAHIAGYPYIRLYAFSVLIVKRESPGW